jgi:hypothetical protein
MSAYWFVVRWYWWASLLVIPLILAYLDFAWRMSNTLSGLAGLPLILVSIPTMVILLIGSKERVKELQPSPSEPLLYDESSASGHSNKTFLLSRVGINRGLAISVTKDMIYVRPKWFLAAVGDIYDLFQKIPIEQILKCDRSWRGIRITWAGETSGDISIRPSEPEKFLAAIGRQAG